MSLLATWGAVVALSQAPVIVSQPELITTYTSYDARFEVLATSPNLPLSYRWYLNGVGALPGNFTNVFGATNASLTLSSLTTANSGGYSVVVSNSSGAVTSAIVNLVIQTLPLPGIRFGQFSTEGSTASIPVTYISQGFETNVAFSVAYANDVLSNPRFVPADHQLLPVPPSGRHFGQASEATINRQVPAENAPGQFGVSLTLTDGAVFPAGPQLLGRVQWDVLSGQSALAGGLLFTNSPFVAQSSPWANGTNVILVLEQAPPVLIGATLVPRLNRQSGLFLQPLQFSNPGGLTLSNALLTVSSLPVDSLTNQITVHNSLSPNNVPAVVRIGQLEPGVTKTLTLEYYVSDHAYWTTNNTLPVFTTSYSIPSTNLIPAGVLFEVNRINSFDYPTAGFSGIALSFSTLTNRSYYILYSDQADFTKTNQVRLVLPPIPGTGSRIQWIDNGPPKTESLPEQSTVRLYRVLEVR